MFLLAPNLSSLCSSSKKSPFLQTRNPLSRLQLFVYLRKALERIKVYFAIVFKPRKRRRELVKDLEGRSENFVVVKGKKKMMIFAIAKRSSNNMPERSFEREEDL
jgi:hypothetical protein